MSPNHLIKSSQVIELVESILPTTSHYETVRLTRTEHLRIFVALFMRIQLTRIGSVRRAVQSQMYTTICGGVLCVAGGDAHFVHVPLLHTFS